MKLDLELLRGKQVTLELLTLEDRDDLFMLARDERIWEFNKMLDTGADYPQQFDRYFRTALDPSAMGDQLCFVIRNTGDREIIGMTRLYEIKPADRTVVIGYTWYIPSVWGKVHNKECKFLLLRAAFEQWNFNRVELRVAHQNVRSQKAVLKLGATQEGVLRKHGYRNDGSIRDTVVYSIIDDEWPRVKEKLRLLIENGEND